MSGNQILLVYTGERSSKLMISCLWMFSSIFSVAKIGFGSNFTGISVGFTLQDVFLIMFLTWLLHKGLTKSIISLMVPWFTITGYGLYHNHWNTLIKMLGILRSCRHASVLPWIAFFISSLALVLRLILLMRIIQMTASLWHKRKMERAKYEQMY